MTEQREKVLALLEEGPNQTLRDVADQAGVSISTVHRIRQGLLPGTTVPLPDEPTSAPSQDNVRALASGTASVPRQDRLTAVPHAPGPRPTVARQVRFMEILSKDPSLRFTDSGRTLLRWLNGHAQDLAVGEQFLAAVPPHCMRAVAEVASQYAKEWERLASTLKQRHAKEFKGAYPE
ncbi:helix-turn-helix domain-containing protein [Streptomyces sp. NPDC017520]|uniref:helix-turn-helix domain-containing protein n=1 Tax=Streptomyces sp. NPDC017520 TaxID=3364998 RepID=UPI00379C2163